METRRNSLNKSRIPFDKNVNLGLWLDTFIEGQDDEKKDGEKFKAKLLNQAANITISDDYKKFFERRLESLAQITSVIHKAIEIDSRMIVGLGGESVWENAISIHRIYGVPFIPGSALKGLAATYARKFLKDFDTSGEAYKFIFGSQESAGFITFHDALLIPVKDEKVIHADIMTVHHQEYYSDGKKPPADWDSPTPINFVSASGKYQLVLTGVEGGEDWLNIVVEILTYALKTEGIGAKTSSGYGRADLTDNFHKTEKMKEAENERKELEEKEKQAEQQRQKEKERLAEQQRQKEKQLAYEAEQQAIANQKQQGEISKTESLSNQISELKTNTKKKDFEKLSTAIYKLTDTEQKKRLALAALNKIEQLQSENPKVDVSDVCIKSLKKMGGKS